MKALCGALLLFLAWPHDVRAQDPPQRLVVRDDFSGNGFSPENWFVCRRPENVISLEPWPDVVRAARLLAHPPTQKVLGLSVPLDEKHAACMDAQGKYQADGAQRAELWETDKLWRKFGESTWIQFDFRVERLPEGAVVPHLVIGQLKANNQHSPVLAQRFADGHFTVTLSQDNAEPNRHKKDRDVGSSRVDLQACKLEYSIVSPK